MGEENVIFVSGSDCYGSPSLEGYRKLVENGYAGTIEDMVEEKYIGHKKDWANYQIGFNRYYGSALQPAKDMHNNILQRPSEEEAFIKYFWKEGKKEGREE